MAIQWFDGFEHYGANTAYLTDGAYAQVTGYSGDYGFTASNPGSGSYAWRFRTGRAAGGGNLLRKVFDTSVSTVGVAIRLRLDSIPTADNSSRIWSIRDNSNTIMVSLMVQANGQISIRRGNTDSAYIADWPEIANSGDYKLTAGIYQHIECKVYHHATAGTVELRVDGITWIDENSLNTGSNNAGQFGLGGRGWTDGPSCNVDDLVIWDTTGTSNNDFIGNKAVYLQMPSADTAVNDMTPTGGPSTAYGCVNGATPNGDTDYLDATTPAETTELDLADLDSAVTSISAIMLFDRSRKTDSGDGNIQKSFVSGSSYSDGADNPMAEAYAFRYDIFEVDPATGSPMTPADWNSGAKIRLARTL